MAPSYGTTPGPQSKLGHAWLPPQIVQIHPAIQPLPAKAPRPTACNVFLHGVFEKTMCWLQRIERRVKL